MENDFSLLHTLFYSCCFAAARSLTARSGELKGFIGSDVLLLVEGVTAAAAAIRAPSI